MAKSTLTTINQIMSIMSKAHYMNGGNASKILAKDKKGLFTIEQVAETLQCDPVELKQVLQQNKIMCGDFVIDELWGDGEKLSTFALRTLNDNLTKQEKQNQNINTYLVIGLWCLLAWLVNWEVATCLMLLFPIVHMVKKASKKETVQDSLTENHKAKGMM